MSKKIVFVILFFLVVLLSLPLLAGPYENALKTNDKVVVYLYAQNCKYCVRFEPVYKKVSEMYDKRCKFLRVDAESKEGLKLMKLFGARYVPFVVLADSKNSEVYQIEPNCLVSFKCTNYFIDRFLRK